MQLRKNTDMMWSETITSTYNILNIQVRNRENIMLLSGSYSYMTHRIYD